ncbi:MAG: hypothetical protein ACLGH8_10630 [Bacteroidia bacterium]
MKKIYLLLIAFSFAFVSCNDNDTETSTTVNSTYLRGTWKEVAPQENTEFSFTSNTAVLTWLADGYSDTYNYTVGDDGIYVGLIGATYPPSKLNIEYVNATTFKITTLYPYPAHPGSVPVTSTFVKQ